MSRLHRDHHDDTQRYHSYANNSSTALSEISSLVGTPGRVLTYGFPDFFRWLARHKRAARAISIALALLLTSANVIKMITACFKHIISWLAASVVISRDDMLYSYFIRWVWRKRILTPQSHVAGQSLAYLFDTETDRRIFMAPARSICVI